MTRRPTAGKDVKAAPVRDAPKQGTRGATAALRPRRKAASGVSAPAEVPLLPRPPTSGGMGLHTAEGEREAFLREADRADRQVRTLCMTLAYAGCRLSEALALTVDRVDLAAGVVTFESLKKRRAGVFRSVPVPPILLEALDMVHGVREAQGRRGRGRGVRLWPWSRMTGWRARKACWTRWPELMRAKNEAVKAEGLTGVQVRDARRLLNWSTERLAGRCGISGVTVNAFEKTGRMTPRMVGRENEPWSAERVAAIRSVLEQEGVEFISGDRPGVKLRKADGGPV